MRLIQNRRNRGPDEALQRLVLEWGHYPTVADVGPDNFMAFVCQRTAQSHLLGNNVLREAWAILGDEITAAWIAERPGTRLWGWWKFQSPEPFRRVSAGFDAPNDPDWSSLAEERATFGVLKVICGRTYELGVTVESEAAYLDRHALLTRAERRALGDAYAREEFLYNPNSFGIVGDNYAPDNGDGEENEDDAFDAPEEWEDD